MTHKTIATLSLLSLLFAVSVCMAQVQSSVYTARDTGRDGRFIAYDNGTVLDTRTNLMWAAKDNGSDINWAEAKSYCENYRGAGYTDWRMPTQDELAGLYDAAKTYKSDCGYDVHLTALIRLSCVLSGHRRREIPPPPLSVSAMACAACPQSGVRSLRALPVCFAK